MNISKDIEAKLERCLRTNPILFTGAGFSFGAENSQGKKIPSGEQLKKDILLNLLAFDESSSEYKELIQYTLSQVCEFARSEKSEAKLSDYIVEQLTGFYPKEYHKIIASSGLWKRVYTVNLDDVFEKSVPQGTLAIQNRMRSISYTSAKQIEYIKLHGCINNPSEGLVFSSQEYIDSMMHSTDYRYNQFAQDMQKEDFVIVGTEMNELDIDYYIKLFGLVSKNTAKGQLFFINPKPSILLKSKVKELGASIIEWTTEQFAEYIKTLPICNNNIIVKEIDGFLYVNKKYDLEKTFKGYRSSLYFGAEPDLKDIIFDWDFPNPEIENLYDRIIELTDLNDKACIIVSLYGKALSGKTIYSKRLSSCFIRDNFAVYEYTGKRFDYYNFANKCKYTKESKIVLIVENASFYYSSLVALKKVFPKEKQLVIITTARTYSHNRRRYCLVPEADYLEIPISGSTNSDTGLFAKNIIDKLDEKGYLGRLKALELKQRVIEVRKYNDVSSFLFSITDGILFRKRLITRFNKFTSKPINGFALDFLTALAFYQKLELPYFPMEMLALWNVDKYNETLSICDDFITIHDDNNGISLRSDVLTKILINKISGHNKIRLLKEILALVSSQTTETIHTYWSEMAASLMKVKLLRSCLNMNMGDIKNLLFDVKSYYNDDFNYWLQVGIAEQYDSDYETALIHFRQAESLSPSSYLVRNAIARNYLRMAHGEKDDLVAKDNFETGEKLMLKLISDSEDFQVKAYSIHCLLYEKVRFYKKHNIIPNKKEANGMVTMLKQVVDKDPNGPMSNHISGIVYSFLKSCNLLSNAFSFQMDDLKLIKKMMQKDGIDVTQMVEDFELD
jgi:hypothetical protein